MSNPFLQPESALVDASWLSAHLHDENLVVLDASVPPVVPGFESINIETLQVIPGARRFDYDKEVCKPDSSLPHMMPGSELFQQKVRALGINQGDLIVVYDDVGIYAAPRAWWMFRAMGHDRVVVLNGGLPAWLAAGNEVGSQHAEMESEGDFIAREDDAMFCDFEVVLASLDDNQCQVLDARSEGRFKGLEPEPRPGVREGHMPSSKSLFFGRLLDGNRLRPVNELKEIIGSLASEGQQVITSCGSGITACILTLAAWESGYRNLSVYDGSWAEWGMPSKLPVVTD